MKTTTLPDSKAEFETEEDMNLVVTKLFKARQYPRRRVKHFKQGLVDVEDDAYYKD